ncbi:fatty acid desaturase family protein [Marinobacter sp. SBS5]|uniref:fatty acid desaturase family protein n=1 Tax=Marinobacter sp. SBS5 TaxID=3401754 RepID=UPI003AAD0E39
MGQGNVQDLDTSLPEHSEGIRVDRALLAATTPYVEQSSATSWRHVGTAFLLMITTLTAAGGIAWWPLRLAFSVLGALLMVRVFITFHDYLHGGILKESRAAHWFFHTYGAFALTPTRSWLASHNYHHGHVGQISDAGVGAFPLLTTEVWQSSTRWQRFAYRAQRHPLVVLLSYPIVFGLNITLLPLLRAPAKHSDSLVALICHSSCLRMNRVMQWFTGNIGYHHIHHLNVRIPFYRLPEVMAAIPELQSPLITTLAPRDIADCFRYALWDEEKQRMVTYREARASS